jgi:putative effector of murein hydrolase LrgA (UPF0299 family)
MTNKRYPNLDRLVVQRTIAALLMASILLRTAMLLHAAWDFNTDDAFITLRYARNLVSGKGIVWNIGENPPAEGYSNFLFVILGALSMKMGCDPIHTFKILGSISLGISCGILYALARLWVSPVGATIPAILLTADIGTIWWTVSGLETSIYQVLVLGAFTAYLLGLGYRSVDESGKRGWERGQGSLGLLGVSGFLIFLAALTRPEGPVIWIALMIPLVVDSTRARHPVSPISRAQTRADEFFRNAGAVIVPALSFAIPYGVYFFWRLFYFQRFFPNSVYCKSNFQDDPFRLVISFVGFSWPIIFLALVSSWRRWDVRHQAIGLILLFYLVIHFKVDPIVSDHNRHFLTVYALLLVPAGAGILRMVQFKRIRTGRRMAELAIVISLVAVTGFLSINLGKIVSRDALHYAGRMKAREGLGEWLNRRLTPGESFVIGDAGLVSFLVDARVIDAYCLNSPEMTRPPINRAPKMFVEMIFRLRPEAIVVSSERKDEMKPHTYFGVFPLIVAHPSLEKEYQNVRTFGAPGDFIQYIVFIRKDRIPLDESD